jgi:hypothetical protein
LEWRETAHRMKFGTFYSFQATPGQMALVDIIK